MTATLLAGISSRTLTTDRLSANILERDGDELTAEAVVFIHGNVSSSLFWQPTMLRLPATYRAIAIDLRGFGDSETLPVDATRGLADYSDDVASVLRALGIESAHFVGWSMGGGVVQQLMLDHNELVATVTLQAPVSPYGFGPTALDGSLLTPDAAGSGAGGVNPDFKERLHSGDRTADEQTSPRSVFRSAYVAPGYQDELEDLWVESMLTTKVTDRKLSRQLHPERELARLRSRRPWRAQHHGTDPLQHHRDRRPRGEAARAVDPRHTGCDRLATRRTST